MNFSSKDIQRVLFSFEALLGILLLGLAWHVWQRCQNSDEILSYFITAVILFIVGIGLIVFAVDTYLLRDDPDIWGPDDPDLWG